jgi:hypothetical protein
MEKVERMLLCELTEQDILDMSQTLGEKLLTLEELETEKKAAAANFKLTADALEAEVSQLGKCVRERKEERAVECEWVYHVPVNGKKQLRRLDTYDVVEEKDMSDKDKQRAADLRQLRLPGLDPELS